MGRHRRALDPMLRTSPRDPGGRAVRGLGRRSGSSARGRPGGDRGRGPRRRSLRLGARLLVAADGRGREARLAGVRARPAAQPLLLLRLLERRGAGEDAAGPNGSGCSTRRRADSPTRTASPSSSPSTHAGGWPSPGRSRGLLPAVAHQLPDGPELTTPSASRRSRQARGAQRDPARGPARGSPSSATPRWPPTRFRGRDRLRLEGAEWLVEETSAALDNGRALDDALRRYAAGSPGASGRTTCRWRISRPLAKMATPLERRAFAGHRRSGFRTRFGQGPRKGAFGLSPPGPAGRGPAPDPPPRPIGDGMNRRERPSSPSPSSVSSYPTR